MGLYKRYRCESVPFFIIFVNHIVIIMAKRKLTQTQMGFIVVLWVLLVGYILMNVKITGMTIISILFSGAIVFIPIYKNLRK